MPVRRPLPVLLALVAAVLWSACSSVDAPPGEDRDASLRELARARGLEIGAAAATGLPATDARYAGVLADEFGMLTPENAMKFGPLRPTRTTFNWTDADALVAFAEEHDMKVRGHTLVWHNQVPGWLGNNLSGADVEQILRDHIVAVVGRYKGRVADWDVVNEAVGDDGRMRDTYWRQKLGPDYIAKAFWWAHEVDPGARLYYNDYGAEGSGRKSDAVYALVSQLVADGVPIHGVGLQMHVSTDFVPNARDVAANIRRLNDLGLDVQITEMDVRTRLPATDAQLAVQAEIYRSTMEVCLAAASCSAFVLWGFTDRHSWIPGTFQGQGAGLIFDASYEPKPAYDALREVLGGE